jgi:hypothetical protein
MAELTTASGIGGAKTEEIMLTLNNATDHEIAQIVDALRSTQHARALSRGDLEELVEVGFAKGFDSKGHAKNPWVEQGVVICPGSVDKRSAASHECAFVHVGDSWIWESEILLVDDVRHTVLGTHAQQRSISLLDASNDLELDFIKSKERQRAHTRVSVTSYRVQDGDVVLVPTRSLRTDDPR